MSMEQSLEERRRKVVELISAKGFMSLSDLALNFDVSESTLRRDLEVLDDQGLVKRTHGGAVYLKDGPMHRLGFAERQTTAAAQKEAIARAVRELIPPNQTVIINGGTTCFDVARAIQGRRLSVVTNSVPIASLLSTDVETEVTLIGGYVYPRTGVALGAMAERQLESLHATQLVMSCAGVTREAAYNANQMMVDVERRMMQIADETILAVDHTKFGMRAVAKLCRLDEVDVIVTDSEVDAETRAWLAEVPARVIYAAPAERLAAAPAEEAKP